MDKLKEYLFAIMTVSLAAGAINMLAPDGKNGALKKQICFAVSLALCAALISPLVGIFTEMTYDIDISVQDDTAGQPKDAAAEVIGQTCEIICRNIEAEASSRYGIEDAKLRLVLNSEDISSVKITAAYFSGSGDLSPAVNFIAQTLNCPVYTAGADP